MQQMIDVQREIQSQQLNTVIDRYVSLIEMNAISALNN